MRNMKNLIVILVIFYSSLGIVGQSKTAEDEWKDLRRLFGDSYRTFLRATNSGFRYVETQDDRVLTIEKDNNVSWVNSTWRVAHINRVEGVPDSECILKGDVIFERLGTGPWTKRTRAVYQSELGKRFSDLSAKEKEKHEHGIDERIREEIKTNATYIAMAPGAFVGAGFAHLNVFEDGYLDDRVLTSLGTEQVNGRSTRKYRILGTNNKIPATVRGTLRKNVFENLYWFDTKTGILAKAILKRVEITGDRIETKIVQYEWEIVPQLVITAPTVGPETPPKPS